MIIFAWGIRRLNIYTKTIARLIIGAIVARVGSSGGISSVYEQCREVAYGTKLPRAHICTVGGDWPGPARRRAGPVRV